MFSVQTNEAIFCEHENPIYNLIVLTYICIFHQKSHIFFIFCFKKKITNFDFLQNYMHLVSEKRFINVVSSQCISDVKLLLYDHKKIYSHPRKSLKCFFIKAPRNISKISKNIFSLKIFTF